MTLTYKNAAGIKATGMPLSSDLFTNLRKDILQGKLRQGEKLTEQQICDTYHVSRTPVREAFKQLELEGLIETIPNRGAFVIGFSPQDFEDMYELRKSYEVLAVKWAIERITKEEFEKLEEAFEFMEFYTQKKDAEKMLNINMRFHELIYAASHNKMLQHVLSSYQIYIKQSKTANTYVDEYLDDVLEEHREIFEAFQNKEVDAGVKAITRHLDHAKLRAK
ncbi:GntR family transcriptional regulator [Sinanaerobacter chloroacetimidivorans]|uniref:GntR family transcriptional regulator n=1 Tax=Sinanaerobacter chloroacetimidivorans TaxID=2818044 RepID=A0A8J7W3S0_9FIRM|nr:GntR family transcriptional regulator [Sinanaerobacter chloroacetimidivorans]MBR0598828.1 GntR family transcriptional regulator [Sinanaerobacter chloroacetimidivorans]